MSDFGNDYHPLVFAKKVRAGKKTYFFDVKSTRQKDYYLIITESKKRFSDGDEKPFFVKNKVYLYKEDFEKFLEGLHESIDYIKRNLPEGSYERYPSFDHTTDLDENDQGFNDHDDRTSESDSGN